ncbi:hypothetical protein GCM10007972_27660 [Iodidimonas muriae]|uniref:Uncharacterized protein n=1 Tax=Iodidimonas muriae TaxID=261467 RepID=A0ABQ2LGU5_9PROT|nr:hypothetical protein [Iodidimonas muriae]GER08807.1 hypothetical protein JCM17843_31170 [Kordiimonadales bacterium JCM 17843]GGO17516.1 hypothetical protein GCM10007972_27660 [Iodidimonas muriae]
MALTDFFSDILNTGLETAVLFRDQALLGKNAATKELEAFLASQEAASLGLAGGQPVTSTAVPESPAGAANATIQTGPLAGVPVWVPWTVGGVALAAGTLVLAARS